MKAPCFISGPVGASKTSTAVSLMVPYLNEGRPVATNIDVFPERLYGLNEIGKAMPIIRIPDEPRAEDLENLGIAFDVATYGHNTNLNGALFIDEIGFSMNCRDWNKAGRAELIRWFRLVRKRHWNLFLLIQDIDAVDKQIFESLCRSIGWCHTSDTLMDSTPNFFLLILLFIPKILFRLFCKFVLQTPRLHFCTFYAGKSISAGIKQETHTFTASIYDGYNTDQEFDNGHEQIRLPVYDAKTRQTVWRDSFVDMRAPYTLLSANYLNKWYPDGVPDRPLTVKQTKEAEKDAKKHRLDALGVNLDKKKKEVMPLSFWLSLPLRYLLLWYIKRFSVRQGYDVDKVKSLYRRKKDHVLGA